MWGDPGRFAHKHQEPQSATSDTSAVTAVKPHSNLGFRCSSRVDQAMFHAASKVNIERTWHQALTMVLDHQRCERWQSHRPKHDFPGVDCKLGMCLSPRHVDGGRQHRSESKGLDIDTKYHWLPGVGYWTLLYSRTTSSWTNGKTLDSSKGSVLQTNRYSEALSAGLCDSYTYSAVASTLGAPGKHTLHSQILQSVALIVLIFDTWLGTHTLCSYL